MPTIYCFAKALNEMDLAVYLMGSLAERLDMAHQINSVEPVQQVWRKSA